jgi:hypothetical protein
MKIRWPGLLILMTSVLAVQSAAAQATPSASAQTAPLVAATPPMGWNSWDSYGLTITEDQFRANVKVLVNDLKPAGYNYAVIDEGWFFFNPEGRSQPATLHYAIDANGRYVPVPARFPSVGAAPPPQTTPASDTAAAPKLAATIEATSFKPLAD